MLANVSDRNPVVERAKNCGIKMCKRLKKTQELVVYCPMTIEKRLRIEELYVLSTRI